MKIGIFDSGMGGLFVLKSLYNKYPDNQYVYYGDTAHLPYGTKSVKQLKSYARNIIEFLRTLHVDSIIVACNTISATLLPEVKKMAAPLPLFDVLSPTVKETVSLVQKKELQNILIIGTPTMIQSKTYYHKIRKELPYVHITDFATPEFVPLIEAGKNNSVEMQKLLQNYFSPYSEADLIVLGCTHYDAIADNIRYFYQEHFNRAPVLVSSAQSIVQELPPLHPTQTNLQIYSSKFSKDFQQMARERFPDAAIQVKNVHIAETISQ